MSLNLSGSIVALVTPFKNGRIDGVALKKLVNRQIEAGTHGIVPCGTTGESPTLSNEEHHRVIEMTVQAVRGRVPVIAGTGSNSTAEAVAMTKHAKRAGADASLSVVPYYNKPTQEGLYRHFKSIAEDAGLPVVLYNIPGRSGVGLNVDTIERLSKVSGIFAIKEATGSLDMATEIIGRTRLTVLSGDDSLTLPLMSVGATGVISVLANAFPEDLVEFMDAFRLGDLYEAKKMHGVMFPFIKSLFIESNPGPIKHVMQLLGLCSAEMRLPMAPISADSKRRVKQALDHYKAATGRKRGSK